MTLVTCPVCQSFESDDNEALENHVDICLVAACRPLPRPIKAPPPPPSSAHSPVLLSDSDSDDEDFLVHSPPPHPRPSPPKSAPPPPSFASLPSSLPLLPQLFMNPSPPLSPLANFDPRDLDDVIDFDDLSPYLSPKRHKPSQSPAPSTAPPAKPVRSLASSASPPSSFPTAVSSAPKQRRSLYDLMRSSSSPSPPPYEEEEKGDDESKERRRASKEKRKEADVGSSDLIQIIEIDELSPPTRSPASMWARAEAKGKVTQAEGRKEGSAGVKVGSSSELTRSVSLVRQFKPSEGVDVGYLDEDDEVQAVDAVEEEQWLLAHPDPFDAAITTAAAQLQRLLQNADLSALISTPSSLPSPSSSSSALTLSSILASLSSSHQVSLRSQRDHYQQRHSRLTRHLNELRQQAKAQLLSVQAECDSRVAVMNELMQEHDRKHQKELEDELSRIRIEEWQKHDRELAALERDKRTAQDQWSIERIEVEERLNRELQSVQQQQTQLQAKLKESNHTFLEEEKAAMDAGRLARIQLKPCKTWQGHTAKEFHFRLAESQFLRMCGSRLQGRYRVKLVEYIVNPDLRHRYDEFVEAERKQNGGADVVEHITFHGTSSDAVEKIIVEGFRYTSQRRHSHHSARSLMLLLPLTFCVRLLCRIGGVDTPIRTAAALGSGIYSSEDPLFASTYIKDGRTQLLFSRVCPSADSVISKGAGGVVQQLVVKNRHQILPVYIVHFTTESDDDGAGDMPGAASVSAAAMLQINRQTAYVARGGKRARRGSRRAAYPPVPPSPNFPFLVPPSMYPSMYPPPGSVFPAVPAPVPLPPGSAAGATSASSAPTSSTWPSTHALPPLSPAQQQMLSSFGILNNAISIAAP